VFCTVALIVCTCWTIVAFIHFYKERIVQLCVCVFVLFGTVVSECRGEAR
jgi:hypothetical protein